MWKLPSYLHPYPYATQLTLIMIHFNFFYLYISSTKKKTVFHTFLNVFFGFSFAKNGMDKCRYGRLKLRSGFKLNKRLAFLNPGRL